MTVLSSPEFMPTLRDLLLREANDRIALADGEQAGAGTGVCGSRHGVGEDLTRVRAGPLPPWKRIAGSGVSDAP